jgi:hypothetical protein
MFSDSGGILPHFLRKLTSADDGNDSNTAGHLF